jgi:DNA-binding MarR family transcriptional regulator
MRTRSTSKRPKPAGETLQFMQRMWEVVHALDVRSKRMERTIGVTGPQRLVLRIVGQSPGKVASEIAATLGIHPSTLTGILARLEERGALLREIDAEDRRRARFRLTALGRKIDGLRRGTVEAAVKRSLARAGDETVASTTRLLGIMVEELERDS